MTTAPRSLMMIGVGARPRTAGLTTAVAVAIAAGALAVGMIAPASRGGEDDHGGEAAATGCAWPEADFPPADRVRSAAAFAQSRGGSVGFAVIDACGGVRGYEQDRQFSAASISKALLLAGFLDEHHQLTGSDRSTLESMITVSDNDAARSIYADVGDDGLVAVARRAGMRDFEPDPGFWGGSQVTAADMARFFFRLDRNLAGPQREFGKHLLATIVESQRWGIPAAAGRGWWIWFKGGWRPPGEEQTTGPVTHQAALLKGESGYTLAIAVLTDETPGDVGGFGTIEGIAERLLRPPPRPRIWIAA